METFLQLLVHFIILLFYYFYDPLTEIWMNIFYAICKYLAILTKLGGYYSLRPCLISSHFSALGV